MYFQFRFRISRIYSELFRFCSFMRAYFPVAVCPPGGSTCAKCAGGISISVRRHGDSSSTLIARSYRYLSVAIAICLSAIYRCSLVCWYLVCLVGFSLLGLGPICQVQILYLYLRYLYIYIDIFKSIWSLLCLYLYTCTHVASVWNSRTRASYIYFIAKLISVRM
jgi:hypothetical protein